MLMRTSRRKALRLGLHKPLQVDMSKLLDNPAGHHLVVNDDMLTQRFADLLIGCS